MADAMMDEFMKFQAEMDAIGAKDAEASENAPTDAPTDHEPTYDDYDAPTEAPTDAPTDATADAGYYYAEGSWN